MHLFAYCLFCHVHFFVANVFMYLRFLKAYCECAASFCYSIKLQLCCFVIECCWSFFGLGLLQALATTKGECQILQFVDIYNFIQL